MNDAAHSLDDSFATSLAGRKLGRYEVLARLASGGMAGVYVARASGVAGFERLFALKVLHAHLAHEEEFVSMFLDEARLAARIRHPNVVPTTDISDTPDAGYYLVMDYIEGDHLGALLQAAFKQGSKLPIPLTMRIIADSLNGLAAAHGVVDDEGRLLNLVHRDISPHNIMVSTDGVSRITDFGVAKSEVRLSSTKKGQFKGKLAYMAPEHASSGQADQRSDLFAMAIILWECLTGRRLFKSENHAATLNKICLEPIPLPSSVSEDLTPFDALLAKGLAREPDDRFQTAEEFGEELEAVAGINGGLANHRVVAKAVREYAAEKLERDKGLIRDGIALVAQGAEGEDSHSMSGPRSVAVPDSGHAAAVPAPVSPARPVPDIPEEQLIAAISAAPAPNRTGVVVGFALMLMAVGISIAILAEEPSQGGVTTSALPGSVAPPIAAPAPVPQPVAPVVKTATTTPTGSVGAEAIAPPTVGLEGAQANEGAVGTDTTREAAAEPAAAAPSPPKAKPRSKASKARAKARAKAKTRKARASSRPSAKPKAASKASPTDDLMFNPYR